MLRYLTRLFSPQERTASAASAADARPRVPVAMHWFADTRLPIVDWERLHEAGNAPPHGEEAHVYWDSAAQAWLEALRDALGSPYHVTGSDDFLLLSTLEARPAQVFLTTCQRMHARIRRNLGSLADDGGWGRYVVMVFDDPDDYYDYVGHSHPDDGEYAMSSGMFIQAGYGHFVMPLEQIDAMEPVIAHELTHCLLAHLPIPAWLNEGLAMNTEHTMFPQLAAPSAQLYFPHEIAAQHAAHWNADSIQAFWSGKSFLATDDGNRLSYDLAKKITALSARDEAAFRAFVAQAHLQDGGLAAEHHLGFPIAHLVEAVLGDGPWQPQPTRWHEGAERGWFGW
ncbi:hypothetical protein [Pseudoxanthomonas sp.]|uniref:hypothetical protein n=1 Tax=Pseudoxanthomonas sp. TaxID=1871049 RepID=UPI0025F7F550|nr:hypothetical protein [Pseudoxanthomonas sp.]